MSQIGQKDKRECVLLIAKWLKIILRISLESLNERICLSISALLIILLKKLIFVHSFDSFLNLLST